MKKKGSSMVFTVLMLAFFLALSLNIYFLARKKAERASIKVQGEVVTNNIDIASSLGYQELLLAEEFVRIGFLYDKDHDYSNDNDQYTQPADGTKPLYIDPATGDFLANKRFAGIQINNFIDYFSSQWNPGTSSNQKLIIGEEASGGKIINRMWQSAGVDSSTTLLWTLPSDTLSIGGYKYIPHDSTDPTNDNNSDPIPTSGTHTGIKVIYEKFIYLDTFTLNTIQVPQSVFRVQVRETFDYDVAASIVSNRNITDFIIQAID